MVQKLINSECNFISVMQSLKIITDGNWVAERRLIEWNKILKLLSLGVTITNTDHSIPILLTEICSRSSEENRQLREVTFKVTYHLMLKEDDITVMTIFRSNQNKLFSDFIFGAMDVSISLRTIAEMCLLRLLTKVLIPSDAFTLVVHQLKKTLDLNNPDVCKMVNWVTETIPASTINRTMENTFLSAFSSQMPQADSMGRRRLMASLALMVSKCDSLFLTKAQEILLQLTLKIDESNHENKPKSKTKKDAKKNTSPMENANNYVGEDNHCSNDMSSFKTCKSTHVASLNGNSLRFVNRPDSSALQSESSFSKSKTNMCVMERSKTAKGGSRSVSIYADLKLSSLK